jgi:hypothetical protein
LCTQVCVCVCMCVCVCVCRDARGLVCEARVLRCNIVWCAVPVLARTAAPAPAPPPCAPAARGRCTHGGPPPALTPPAPPLHPGPPPRPTPPPPLRPSPPFTTSRGSAWSPRGFGRCGLGGCRAVAGAIVLLSLLPPPVWLRVTPRSALLHRAVPYYAKPYCNIHHTPPYTNPYHAIPYHTM